MRRNLFGTLLGLLLVALLVTVPLAGAALAVSDTGDNSAGHDMSTMNQSDQNSGHDMSNMDGMDMGGTNTNDSSAGDHGSSGGGDHDSAGSGGHGESTGDANTPPNWPVIYGFGAVNLLVIIIAALLKNKNVRIVVN